MKTADEIRKGGATFTGHADMARGAYCNFYVSNVEPRITISKGVEKRGEPEQVRFYVQGHGGALAEGAFGTLEEAVDALNGTTHGFTMEQQAAAIERAAANWRGHRHRIQELVSQKKRPLSELDMLDQWVPQLEAAAISFRRFLTAAGQMPVEPPTKEQLEQAKEPTLL